MIDWCNRNRFLVFTGTLPLVLAGVWALRRIPLDALPDISDVEVIIHTPWAGEPPSIIEDQVTYPIVTTLLAAPHVKAVRAQTMFGDSYVFVVFEDGTEPLLGAIACAGVYAADHRATAEGVHPVIGPDATGAVGSMNTPWWTTAINTAWPICAASRTGICATNSKPFLASLKSRRLAGLFASIR